MADEETHLPEDDAPAPDPRAGWTMEQRLEYLETQNEGLKRVGGLALALVLLLGVLLVQQVYSNMSSVSTRAVTLLKTNNELAVAITPDNEGRLQFLPARAGVLNPPQPLPPGFVGTAFYDTLGKLRVVIGTDAEDRTVFGVFDPRRGLQFFPLEQMKPMAPGKKPEAAPQAPSPTPAVP